MRVIENLRYIRSIDSAHENGLEEVIPLPPLERPSYDQYYEWRKKYESKGENLENSRRRRSGNKSFDANERPLLGKTSDLAYYPGLFDAVDATKLEVRLCLSTNRRKFIDRVEAHVVIDLNSIFIRDFHLALDGENYGNTAITLANAYTSKVARCKRLGWYITDEMWPYYIGPNLIWDRGPGYIGINATRNEKLGYLRYCPACILKERAQMGFSYWHRTHQLPQVDVCAIHEVWLEESPVQIETTKKRFITAESAIIQSNEATLVNPYASLDHTITILTQDAEWLLNQPDLELGPELIVERYCILLSRMKLASPTGKPNFDRIRNALNEAFEHDTLIYLEHQLGESSSRDWLYRLFITGRAGLFQSPVSHLLFMQFLGIKPSNFFSAAFDLPLFFFAQNKE